MSKKYFTDEATLDTDKPVFIILVFAESAHKKNRHIGKPFVFRSNRADISVQEAQREVDLLFDFRNGEITVTSVQAWLYSAIESI